MSIVRTAPADPRGRTRRIAVVNSNSSAVVTRQLADTVEPALLPASILLHTAAPKSRHKKFLKLKRMHLCCWIESPSELP